MHSEMIFAVSDSELDDEVGYVLLTTTKESWDKEHRCDDSFEQDFYIFMEENGFHEIEEGMWEHEDGLSRKELLDLGESIGLIHNSEFEEYMNDIIKGDI